MHWKKTLLVLAIVAVIVTTLISQQEIFIGMVGPNYERFVQESNAPHWTMQTNSFHVQSTPAFLQVSDAQRIPRILHQTAPRADLDIQVYETCMINRGMNPEYEYRFYTDREMNEFIQTYFPQYKDLYDTVIPGAFRADLFRYMVLHVHGGVYLDCKSSTILPLRDFLPPNATFASFLDKISTTIQISFLAATSKHPVIEACITQAFDHIARQEYGRFAFDITGPMLCGRMFNRVLGHDELDLIEIGAYGVEKDLVILGALKHVGPSQNYEVLVDGSDQPLVSRACGKYYQSRLLTDHWNSYGVQWFTGRVYKTPLTPPS